MPFWLNFFRLHCIGHNETNSAHFTIFLSLRSEKRPNRPRKEPRVGLERLFSPSEAALGLPSDEAGRRAYATEA